MFRRMLALVAIALAAMASTASGSILINSFEQGGFSSAGAEVTSYSYSATTGITEGSYSLVCNVTSTWYGSMGVQDMDPVVFKSNPEISIDVAHADTGSGQWTNFLNVFAVVQGSGVGWTELSSLSVPNDGQPHTLTWNASAQLANLGTEWAQFVLIYATQEPHPVYVDNLRLNAVPEPGILGIVCLCGVAALLRRRRKR